MTPRKLSRSELERKWALWNLSNFNGLPGEDPQAFISEIDTGCQKSGIPISQRMLTTVHFLGGSSKVAMKVVKKDIQSQNDSSCQVKWDSFRDVLVKQYRDEHGGTGGEADIDDRVKLVAGGGLLVAGSSAVLPSLGILGINAVGFTPAGVAAGSLAAAIQSAIYGASTGGLFSILQSIGATAVVAPPLAIGLGVAAIGAGVACTLSSRGKDRDPGEGESSDGDGGDDDEKDFEECDCDTCRIDKNAGTPEASSSRIQGRRLNKK